MISIGKTNKTEAVNAYLIKNSKGDGEGGKEKKKERERGGESPKICFPAPFFQTLDRIGYATGGTLFISTLSPKGLGSNKNVKETQRRSTHVNMRPVRPGYKTN